MTSREAAGETAPDTVIRSPYSTCEEDHVADTDVAGDSATAGEQTARATTETNIGARYRQVILSIGDTSNREVRTGHRLYRDRRRLS